MKLRVHRISCAVSHGLCDHANIILFYENITMTRASTTDIFLKVISANSTNELYSNTFTAFNQSIALPWNNGFFSMLLMFSRKCMDRHCFIWTSSSKTEIMKFTVRRCMKHVFDNNVLNRVVLINVITNGRIHWLIFFLFYLLDALFTSNKISTIFKTGQLSISKLIRLFSRSCSTSQSGPFQTLNFVDLTSLSQNC